ncbi:MAG: beta-ketoacyl synthase N-terminal-like domain-containing protein, partial [Nitrospinota bacterium]
MFPRNGYPRRVVVTGVGAVSPFGIGLSTYWDGLKDGRSGLGPVTLFDASSLPCQVVAEVPGFDPDAWVARRDRGRLSRMVPMALLAAREALEQSGLTGDALSSEERLSTGVIVGTGGGGVDFAEAQYKAYFSQNGRGASPFAISSSFAGTLSSEISIALGLEGPSHVLSTGCTA